jgi:hypothetical protein
MPIYRRRDYLLAQKVLRRVSTFLAFASCALIPSSLWAKTKAAEIELPPVDPTWKRADAMRAKIGAYDYRHDGLFTVDIRPLEPARSLAACRSGEEYWRLRACELFLYPSADSVAGAEEARQLYEQEFQGKQNPAERIAWAIQTQGLSADWEIRKYATPDVLNSFVLKYNGPEQITVAEWFAKDNDAYPQKVQWLYDRGAQLCMKDPPMAVERFSCIQFYLGLERRSINIGGVSMGNRPFLETIAVMEKNGFRSQTKSEIASAASWVDVLGSDGPTKQRYYNLLTPALKRQVEALAAVKQRERRETYDRERQTEHNELIRQTSSSGSTGRSRTRITVMAERGLPVCQVVSSNGREYVFRAVLEGRGGKRLQFRASSITAPGSEVRNMPYADTRVDLGTIFWDDPEKWWSGC